MRRIQQCKQRGKLAIAIIALFNVESLLGSADLIINTKITSFKHKLKGCIL